MSILAWGSNHHHELGVDSNATQLANLSAIPVLVTQLEGAGYVDVSAGNGHTMLLTSNGDVFSYGKSSDGQLGVGLQPRSSSSSLLAAQVKDNGLGDCRVAKIVAGDGCSAALTSHGVLYEWGFIHSRPDTGDKSSMGGAASNALPGLVERSRMQISDRLKNLLRESELEYLMGGGSEAEHNISTEAEAGVLAVRTKRQRAFLPVRSLFKRPIRDVALGYGHCLAITQDDSLLWAKGYNDRGQLGVGTRVNEVEFVPVLGLLKGRPVKSVACGSAHNLAVLAGGEGEGEGGGELYSWGSNVLGQLGLSAGVADQLSPALVTLNEEGAELADKVACGSYHSVVLSTKRTLYSFGHAEYGQHGSLDTEAQHDDFRHLLRHFFTPQPVWRFNAEDVVLQDIYVGQQYNAALDVNGQLWTWGFGAAGNLGHGVKQRGTAPQVVEALLGHRLLRVAAGHKHMVVIIAPEGNPFALRSGGLLLLQTEGGSFADAVVDGGGNRGGYSTAKCHRALVLCRCPALLQYATAQDVGVTRFVLPIPTERLVVRALVEYLYCDVVRSCPPHRLKDLQDLATKLALPRLAEVCAVQRYQRHVREGFLMPTEAAAAPVISTPSSYASDMLRLLNMGGSGCDVRLAAADYSGQDEAKRAAAALPPQGHTAFSWYTDDDKFTPQGHTAFSWPPTAPAAAAHPGVFGVHKMLLQRYPFFAVLFNGNFRESEVVRTGGVVKLGTIPTGDALRSLLEWIYSGSVASNGSGGGDGINEDNVADLVQAAQAFGVQDLTLACERFLLEILHPDNAHDILALARDHFMGRLAIECDSKINI